MSKFNPKPELAISRYDQIAKIYGGCRKGSGRKPLGKVTFRARVFPRQIPPIKDFIKTLP